MSYTILFNKIFTINDGNYFDLHHDQCQIFRTCAAASLHINQLISKNGWTDFGFQVITLDELEIRKVMYQ